MFMPDRETKYFGTLSYEPPAVIEFPAGLPGFAHCRQFLPIEDAARRPLIFLQSLEDTELCFLTLRVEAVDPGYLLKMSPEDLALAGFDALPALGAEALCLAVITAFAGEMPTVNLLAPIVVNRATRRAVQSVRDDSVYGCRHPLGDAAEWPPCS
jgi:flagellar assembly factor FliW